MEGKEELVFVIDTNQYAGNFEREMCSYLTGVEDYRGEIYAKLAKKEIAGNVKGYWKTAGYPLVYLVQERAYDDGDCPRYTHVQIWLSPDGKYNSVAIHISRELSVEEIKLLADRARKFTTLGKRIESGRYIPGKDMKILGFRIVTIKTSYEEEIWDDV